MATNIGTLMATVGIDTRPLKKGLKDAERQTQTSTKKMLGHWKSMAAGIVATYAIYKTANLIKETALLAARFETLGVVMEVVGKNAGYSAKEMDEFDLALRKTGISMVESRQSLARMAMAQLDLNKATELGRIAQNAAVIGQLNSSEAFERMIYGIQSGNLIVLKTIGINVSFEDSYKKVAEATGRVATSFTQNEKALIRMHAVLEYGPRIMEVYEAAMTTAGKKMYSLKRHIDDFKTIMGKAFTPATVILVDAVTVAMKEMQKEIAKPEAQEALKNLSTQLAKTIVQLGRDLPKAIEKTTDAIASIHALYNVLPEGVIGAAGAGLIGRMLFGGWGAAKVVAALSLINTQMEKFDTGIWEGVEVKWGLSAIVDSYWDAVNALQKIQDEMAGRTIKGVPAEPLVKHFKITGRPAIKPSPISEPTVDKDWMEQFRIKNELRLEMEEQFNNDYSNLVFSRWDLERKKVKELQILYTDAGFEKTKIAEIISDKMKAISDDETEYKKHQLEVEQEIEDARWAMIVEAMEKRQELRELEKEFDQEYAEMGKSRFDLERMEVERTREIYEKAGVDKVKIAKLTSDKMKAISKAENAQRLSDIHSTVSTMTQGFQQISEMGGKHSKKAFAAYKAFKMVETLISTYSGAMKAYESMLSIPIVGKALGIAAAAAVVGFGMAQVASISAMQAPSYDRGGVSRAGGLYQTGNIDEAHIPLESGGTIPVRFDSRSEEQKEQTPINIINVNDPSQLDMYLASSRGQDAILNVLGSRNQAAKRLLR
jgi:hypothetical protein